MRPGDHGYNRAALGACVEEMKSAAVPVTVESTWREPPRQDELRYDDTGVGWHGQLGANPPSALA